MFLSFCLVFANFIFALLIKLLLIKKGLSELTSLGETTNCLIDALQKLFNSFKISLIINQTTSYLVRLITPISHRIYQYS